MQRYALLLSLAAVMLISCTKASQFKPSADATPESVFQNACSNCHNAYQHGQPLNLYEGQRTADDIANKIYSGGLMMPSFPNLSEKHRLELTQWILEHN